MLTDIAEAVAGVLRYIHWTDLLDVALLTAFLFAVLSWLRRNLSRAVFIVLAAALGVYVVAVRLDLYLVQLLIQGLFGLFVLSTIVVFQSDIRRAVGRLETLSFRRSADDRPASAPFIDALVESASQMAERHVGALIALKGEEPWERHIDGGTELDSVISFPLLCSLFDPSSPTHDGAVLIAGRRITAFGAHLPLSTNLSAVGTGGTRHTAALGLAEVSDALVVVVSEERGTISVAEGGDLAVMDSTTALKRRLESFWQRHYAPGEDSSSWWNQRRLLTFAASLTIAVMVWLAFSYNPGIVFRTVTVPIEMRGLPSSYVLDEPPPSEATITLSGPEGVIRLLNENSLLVSLDLSGVQEGQNTLDIEEGDILQLPGRVDLLQVEPRTIPIDVEEITYTSLPVRVPTTGTLSDSLELVGITATPATVRVGSTEDTTERPDSIATEPLNLDTIQATRTVRRQLALPEGLRLPPQTSSAISIRVRVRPRARTETTQTPPP